MNPSDLSDMIMAVSIIGTVTLSVSFLYVVTRAVQIWGLKAKAQVRQQPSDYDASAIERLQASVDAISIEVERISEGQRFTTKLMNERIPEVALATPSKDTASRISQ